MLVTLLSLALADPEPLLRPEERAAVLQALAALDVTVADLSFEKDYVHADGILRDHWRLPGVARLLHAPLELPDDATRWSHGLSAAAGDPTAALAALSEATGVHPVALPPWPAADCAPAKSKAWKTLHPTIRTHVCALADLHQGLSQAIPRDLPDEPLDTLRTLLAPDGEDGWDATESQRRTRGLLAALDHHDRAIRVAAASEALAVLARAEADLAALPAGAWPAQAVVFAFPGFAVAVGSPGPDRLAAPLSLDPGGDDHYAVPADPVLALHLDLGGDDTWTGGDGTLGGTIGGVAVAIDVAGNDTWRGGRASLGAGVLGVGILVDRAGDDSYRGVATTEGAGTAGIGLLLDHAGSDTYDAAAYAQGFAGTVGVGGLWDGGGDDLYRAGGTYPDMPTRFPDHTLSLSQGFSIGLRPDAGGGLGLLVDDSGNDAYDADLFAQGCSYWFSRGYLVDRAGNDRYHTYQYGQGSGIHLSVAGLFDLAGQDAYSAGNLVQGSSHDFAVGWLVDRAGDDVYAANSTAQGGSLTNSVTFLVDGGGDDAYVARLPFSQGAGRYDRNMGAIGALIDLGGEDVAAGPGGTHGLGDGARRPWAYGVVIHGASSLPAPDPEVPVPPMVVLRDPPPSPPSTRPVADAQALADLAAADSVGCQDPPACEARRAELAAEGPATFARLLPALERDILQEGYTLDALLRAMRSPEADPVLHRLLLDHLAAGPNYQAERWIARWLGALAIDPAATADALAPLAHDDDPRLRSAVANAILAWKTAPPLLDALAADADAQVRAVAALALGEGGAAVDRIVPLLDDPSVLVRFNAASALDARPPETVRAALVARWRRGDFSSPVARRLVLELLIRVGGRDADRIVQAVAAGDADAWAARKARDAKSERFSWR